MPGSNVHKAAGLAHCTESHRPQRAKQSQITSFPGPAPGERRFPGQTPLRQAIRAPHPAQAEKQGGTVSRSNGCGAAAPRPAWPAHSCPGPFESSALPAKRSVPVPIWPPLSPGQAHSASSTAWTASGPAAESPGWPRQCCAKKRGPTGILRFTLSPPPSLKAGMPHCGGTAPRFPSTRSAPPPLRRGFLHFPAFLSKKWKFRRFCHQNVTIFHLLFPACRKTLNISFSFVSCFPLRQRL